ncbi:hypothetical protein [Paenibacillus ihumii]|uniref:hypothetical protein n=1 Tax=Paenibacillus ihumii TaxID=687436 RepID=UPI0006D76314|nr:hypothetical protein [Paenibacillus ihumii]
MEKGNVTNEQLDLVHRFFKVVFGDNVEEYWEIICKADQSRVYGMYMQHTQNGGNVTFKDYIQNQIKVEHAKIYEKYKENSPGISSQLRFSDEGEATILIMEDVKVPRVYITPTEVMTIPLTLTIDTYYNKGDIVLKWKVRLYADNNYSRL